MLHNVQPNKWNMGLGRLVMVFLLLQALVLEDNHIPTFLLLLQATLDWFFDGAWDSVPTYAWPHNST